MNVNEFFRRAGEPAKRFYQHVAKAAATVAWALAVLIGSAGIPDVAHAESENLSQISNENAETANQYASKARAHYEQGNYAPALDLYLKTLSIREKVLGKEHPDTATTYNNIAKVYDSQGDYPKALEWNLKALSVREKVLGKGHPDTAASYNNIAGVYYNQGAYPVALDWLRKALAIREKILGKEHPETSILKQPRHNLLHEVPLHTKGAKRP